ncbi:helix-turn-helix domain-containing protein [Bacillus cytotoxicus]|uniref:helix-turn-helix transcriptional regulator n=1 Tax=unclassified Bacillus cereus group TaxID=2750818 RepID=UPI001F5ADDA8|nr:MULTISPECIES: helix-turn-helix domain-containing protein [unclassified Bacillus cereus group]EMA6341582.1 helix-turn-helix domain-containing protein [Bacillus cytotoxicus]
MEQALKITGVLSDPTRYYIYKYISQKHSYVTVQEIAEEFNIHPNVARLHLSKLEDVNMLKSETKKTGKGGRPSRLYILSEDVIQLQFPFRDYQLLANISLNALLSLGEPGKKALYETGKQLGKEIMEQHLHRLNVHEDSLTLEHKVQIAKEALSTAGLSPSFELSTDGTKVFYNVYNCPFKEIAVHHPNEVCNMHGDMMKGVFEVLFPHMELQRHDNLLDGCKSCNYTVNL